MLTCKEATRLCSEALDRNLDLRERLSLRMHLMMCKGCTNFEQQMQQLRELTRGYSSGEAVLDDGRTTSATAKKPEH